MDGSDLRLTRRLPLYEALTVPRGFILYYVMLCYTIIV